MDPLRARVIRLAYQNPDLRPQLLPLVKKADEFSPEEEAVILWDSTFEREYNAVLKRWFDRYYRGLMDLDQKLHFWFYERPDNLQNTPVGEMPNLKGMKDALFYRRRKMVNDLTVSLKELLDGTDMTDELNEVLLRFNRAYSER
jgi:hypothetical protein